MSVAITVTKDHVKHQTQGDYMACAVALAINEKIEPQTRLKPHVMTKGWRLRNDDGLFIWQQWLDDRTRLLIKLLDYSLLAELPHTFTTYIPRKYLKDSVRK